MWGWMVAQDFIIKPGRMSQLGVILTVLSTPWDPASVDSANSISHTLKGRRGLLSRKGWWGGGFSEHLSEFAKRLWTSSLVGSMQCVQSNQRRRNVKEQTDWCKKCSAEWTAVKEHSCFCPFSQAIYRPASSVCSLFLDFWFVPLGLNALFLLLKTSKCPMPMEDEDDCCVGFCLPSQPVCGHPTQLKY